MTPISEKNEENDIEVYPNPFADELVLNLNEYVAGGIIKFFDTTGKMLKNTEINSTVSTISTRDLAQGIYFLSFQNGDRITKFKIVKL